MITEEGTRLYPVNIRYAFPPELDLMARLAGLRAADRWGNWGRRAVHRCEHLPRLGVRPVNEPLRVACVQAEPVILDRARTLDKLAALTAEAKRTAARSSSSSPRRSSPRTRARPGRSSSPAGPTRARRARSRMLARESVDGARAGCDRLGAIAREHEVWLVTGVNERDPERPRHALQHAALPRPGRHARASHHRKLVPTNHERLVWGQGDGGGLRAIPQRRSGASAA